ncbi:MAG: AsmA family protein [Rubrivivax sp.]|nr:AsmA family protein [Rubrivivax sp.]
MPKALKITLAALGGLALLLLLAAVVLFATFDPNSYKPLLIETVHKERQRTLAIPGPISLTLFPRLGVKAGAVTLSERNSAERFASIESAQVSLAVWPLLRRQVVVDRLAVSGLRARIVRFKDGKLSIDDLASGSGTPPTPTEAPTSPPLKLDIAGIALTDAEVTFDDRQAPRRVQLSKIDLQAGRIAPGVPTPVSLKARVDADSPQLGADLAVQGRLLLGPAPGRLALEGLEVDLDAKLGGQALKGRLTGTLEADTEARKANAPKLELDLRLTNPGDAKAAPLTLAAKGTAALNYGDKGRLDAKLAGQFDEGRFSATVAMPRLSPAAYTFDAELDRLNLDRLRPGGSAPAAGAGAGPEKPLDLSALRDLEASGQLRIGALQVMNLKASQVRASVRATGGRLNVSPLTAELYQGRLNGSASVAATQPVRVGLQQTLEGIAIGPLLKDLTGNDALQGRGNVTLDVNTAGATVGAMTKALAGTARLELKDGSVRGINVAQTIRRARALAKGNADGTAAKGEATDFSELTASFRIAQGVARNDDLALKSPLLRVGGSGDVDLGASRLDYTVRATIVDTLKGQGGAELDALRGRTVPVKLYGPFDAIAWRIDFGALVKEAAQAKIDEKKEALKEDAKRRLADRLRGVLGK